MNIKQISGYLRRFLFTRYFTLRKLFNLIRIFYEYKSRKDVLKAYPCKLIMDTSNICNLGCPLCPTGKGEKGRTKALMKFADFRKIVDEAKDCLYEIDLYNWGEPLMNRDIFRMIDYARRNNIKTRISTNLNYFRKDFARKIVGSGLDYLIMSIDGASQKTYEKYRRGGDFDRVINNIRKIAAEKKRQGRKKPYLVWQFLVMRQNEHELPKARRMARKIGIDIMRVEPVRSDIGKEIFQSDEEKIKGSRKWLPEDEELSRFDYRKMEKKVKKKSCIFLWSMPVINPNGSVSPCCAVYPEKHDFGNAFEQGLMKIWNNEKYVASRRIVSGKKSKIRTVCENCVRFGFIE